MRKLLLISLLVTAGAFGDPDEREVIGVGLLSVDGAASLTDPYQDNRHSHRAHEVALQSLGGL